MVYFVDCLINYIHSEIYPELNGFVSTAKNTMGPAPQNICNSVINEFVVLSNKGKATM